MSGLTSIQRAIHQLLCSEPFYAHFLLNSNIVYDKFKVPTAGVCVIHGVPTFVFNSEFIGKMNEAQCKAILKHEVLHLVLAHLRGFKNVNHEDRYLWNIAQDCAINQYLYDLPEGCITLGNLSKVTGHDLLPYETSAYYYSFLKEKQAELRKAGIDTLDEHDIEAGDRGSEKVNQAAVRRITRRAVGKSAGNAPQHILNNLAADSRPSLPWKQILRNFVFKNVSAVTLSTQKKVNRRFAMPVPGKKKKRTLTLGVCLDSSGSISDSQYSSFLSEVKAISNQVTTTWLVHADSRVNKVEKLTAQSKLKPVRAGGGGTAYQPAIDKCLELRCDVIIYFGDFDTSDIPIDPKVPFLWVGVGDQRPPADFGKVLRLTTGEQ